MPDDGQYGKIELILIAVRNQLISSVTGGSASIVLISDDPNTKLSAPTDDRWFIITPSSQSRFDPSAADGGGRQQLTVRTRIVVTVHFISGLDDPDLIDQFFTSTQRSINIAKLEVLKALTDFLPLGDEDEPLANDPLLPAELNWAKTSTEGSMQIAFDVDYDEDLR